MYILTKEEHNNVNLQWSRPERKIFPVIRSVCDHFGDKSWRQAKGELLEEEGDTPSIFPGESVEELTLLRLPSS